LPAKFFAFYVHKILDVSRSFLGFILFRDLAKRFSVKLFLPLCCILLRFASDRRVLFAWRSRGGGGKPSQTANTPCSVHRRAAFLFSNIRSSSVPAAQGVSFFFAIFLYFYDVLCAAFSFIMLLFASQRRTEKRHMTLRCCFCF